MIPRRKLVLALGAAACAPFASIAQQQGKIWRVGVLSYSRRTFDDADYFHGPFMQGMRELGYVEGRNLAVEWRSAEVQVERLPELAAELVRLKVNILVTLGTPAAQAAQKATRSIPIVMSGVGDPVGTGLVKSLARPGGNSTALSLVVPDLGAKLLGLLREATPKVIGVAVLVSPGNPMNRAVLKNLQAAAPEVGFQILPVHAGTRQEIEDGFAVMARQNAGALYVAQDGFFFEHRHRVAELALKQRLPSVSTSVGYVQAGGLMCYGHDTRENPRRAATYVDKIFRGAKPGDIPVEQPTTFELLVNLKTASALGITFPPSILARATRVIE